MRLRAEDSLENTFSCVPKVQGERRISQANGQRRMKEIAQSSPFLGCVFCLQRILKEVIMYALKTH